LNSFAVKPTTTQLGLEKYN